MTIPSHYPQIAAEAATKIAEARAAGGATAAYRAAMTLSVEQIEALGLVAAAILEPAYPQRRWSNDRAAGRPAL
jgi:hypothetical protein